jgi:DNA-binding NarL/FixJ family response regulator
MPTDQPIRVGIIEDKRPAREGLAMLIDGTPGYRCVGRFSSMEEARRLIGHEVPDVLLLDIHLPGMSGSEGARLLKEQYPTMQILMLTIYEDEDKVFESICNGASGYLLKKTPPAKLLDAIREAHDGGSPMSPEIARKVITVFQKTGPPEKPDQALTPQEVRLLKLLADGYGYKAAAERMTISVNTVRQYIRSIYDKLHVHSKNEAVSKALRSRIIY